MKLMGFYDAGFGNPDTFGRSFGILTRVAIKATIRAGGSLNVSVVGPFGPPAVGSSTKVLAVDRKDVGCPSEISESAGVLTGTLSGRGQHPVEFHDNRECRRNPERPQSAGHLGERRWFYNIAQWQQRMYATVYAGRHTDVLAGTNTVSTTSGCALLRVRVW